MDSWVPKPRRRANLTRRALAAGLVLLLAGGCQAGTQGEGEVRLNNLVCLQSDLPVNYRAQTSGDFSLGNLADLSADATARRAELHAAGLLGGYFSSWREVVGDPPFPPPIDIVCQVIRFQTDAQAQAFVASLRPEPGDLATTAISWIPSDNQRVVELAAAAREGARAFAMTASDANVHVTIYAVVGAVGPYVETVYVGDPRGETSIAQAAALEAETARHAEAALNR